MMNPFFNFFPNTSNPSKLLPVKVVSNPLPNLTIDPYHNPLQKRPSTPLEPFTHDSTEKRFKLTDTDHIVKIEHDLDHKTPELPIQMPKAPIDFAYQAQFLAQIQNQIQAQARKLFEIHNIQKMTEFMQMNSLLPTPKLLPTITPTPLPTLAKKNPPPKKLTPKPKPSASSKSRLSNKSSPPKSQTMDTSLSFEGVKTPQNFSSFCHNDDGINIKLESQDTTMEGSSEGPSNMEPIEPPALVTLTKEFPDWDLGKIVEFVGMGKNRNDLQKKMLRGAEGYEFEELFTEKKEDEVERNLTEEEKEECVDELTIKLSEVLGFSDVNKTKVAAILARKKFYPHKALAFVKKNITFYKRFFKLNKDVETEQMQEGDVINNVNESA